MRNGQKEKKVEFLNLSLEMSFKKSINSLIGLVNCLCICEFFFRDDL